MFYLEKSFTWKKVLLGKGRFVHWVVHMLYTIRKKFYLEKSFTWKFHLEKFYLEKVLLGRSVRTLGRT